jgi:predicted O-methyltransferase YrrM
VTSDEALRDARNREPNPAQALTGAVEVLQRQFPNSTGALPFFPGIGRTLLPPDWRRPALVVPLDGHYVVEHPVINRSCSWLVDLFARSKVEFLKTLGLAKTKLDFSSLPKRDMDGVTPFFPNSFFGPMDAAALTALIQLLRPKLYIEIGSGMSTRFARRAIKEANLQTKIVCIDPAPRSSVASIADEIIEENLLNVDARIFESLNANDILFFDGSHLSFSGTDCPEFFLGILPRINRGVYVHVHDIFLPNDYPERLRTRFYNEQQLLAAFLVFNNEFEVILPVNYLHSIGACPEGVSFWLKRAAT